MEIRALSLRIGEEEINHWVTRAVAQQEEMRGLSVEVVPQRIIIQGEYFIMRMWLPFNAQIELGAEQGRVVVRLDGIQAVGFFPVESMVIPKLAKLEREWLHVEGATLTLDVEKLLDGLGVPSTLNLTGIRCEPGAVILEANAPEE